MRKKFLLVIALTLGGGLLWYFHHGAELSTVRVSTSIDLGKTNPDFFATFKDEPSLQFFQEMLDLAVKDDDIAEITTPDFDLKFIYRGGQLNQYHLWLGQMGQESMLMKIGDTTKIYSLPAEFTNQLLHFAY